MRKSVTNKPVSIAERRQFLKDATKIATGSVVVATNLIRTVVIDAAVVATTLLIAGRVKRDYESAQHLLEHFPHTNIRVSEVVDAISWINDHRDFVLQQDHPKVKDLINLKLQDFQINSSEYRSQTKLSQKIQSLTEKFLHYKWVRSKFEEQERNKRRENLQPVILRGDEIIA